MKTCKEMAEVWNVTERTVTTFCKSGKIPGAVKKGKSWQIPDDAEKPVDGRVSSGKYMKKPVPREKKPLPVGISDYVRAQSEYYYVDKTMLIKEFLDQKPLVSLFTRPRRFGKTLNMDMLRVFFEISEEDTSKYFVDKDIWKCGEEYRSHQGKYPVVFLTFKDVKFDSWEATMDKIRGLLQEEFGRHQELLDSDRIAKYEKEYFTRVMEGTANEVDLTSALEKLSKMLKSHYGKAPVIIIDEYDTPIQEGYSKEFYDEIIGFMRNFFSGAFKDNRNLSYGFLVYKRKHTMLKLIRRCQEYVSGYREYCQEAYDNHVIYFRPTNPKLIDNEWFSRTKDWYDKKETGQIQGQPISFHFWAVDDEKFIGEFQLRTELTPEVMSGIGSIGYAVRVSEQGKGYGTEILKQGLLIAKEHGMNKVLMNINDKNSVSAHVCEKLGGKLMDKIQAYNDAEGCHIMRRYWIYL